MDFIDPDWLYLLTVPFVLMPLLAVIGNAKRKKRLAMILGKMPIPLKRSIFPG